MVSTQMTPSCSALCASIGGPATSPMAQTPGTLVRAVIVDDDGAAVDLHAELLEPEILGIADDADRRDQPLGRDVCGLALPSSIVRDDAVGGLVDLGDLGVGHELDAALFERLRACAAISASSTGRICGSSSMIVTSAPSER